MACEGADRISSLPDPLLSHVLSFLPTHDAFQTSFLSKRWKFLFASTPTLHFHDAPFYVRRNKKTRRSETARMHFINFVNRALLLRDGVRIHKFRLHCVNPYDHKNIYTWISATLRHNVGEMELNIPISDPLPCDLFNSKTLVVLKAEMLSDLKVPCLLRLPSLKVLHLSNMSFHGDDSGLRLISACHVLEELRMHCVTSGNGLIPISISTLKTLSVQSFNGKLVLDTPCLDHLCINGVTQGYTWRNTVKSLALACLQLSLDDLLRQHQNCSIFAPISELNQLCLVSYFMKGLEVAHLGLPPSFKLTHLWFKYTSHDKISAPTILTFLGYFPKIKIITLTWDNNVWTEKEFPECSPTCLFSELLEVNIKAFYGHESELTILEYFLINARVLKKMTIKSCISSTEKWQHTTNRLLSLPRLSNACVITFT